eukprot:349839-Chlamydomonas_euryale.AAC.4
MPRRCSCGINGGKLPAPGPFSPFHPPSPRQDQQQQQQRACPHLHPSSSRRSSNVPAPISTLAAAAAACPASKAVTRHASSAPAVSPSACARRTATCWTWWDARSTSS